MPIGARSTRALNPASVTRDAARPLASRTSNSASSSESSAIRTRRGTVTLVLRQGLAAVVDMDAPGPWGDGADAPRLVPLQQDALPGNKYREPSHAPFIREGTCCVRASSVPGILVTLCTEEVAMAQ